MMQFTVRVYWIPLTARIAMPNGWIWELKLIFSDSEINSPQGSWECGGGKGFSNFSPNDACVWTRWDPTEITISTDPTCEKMFASVCNLCSHVLACLCACRNAIWIISFPLSRNWFSSNLVSLKWFRAQLSDDRMWRKKGWQEEVRWKFNI